jgi:hypothetical protein
VATEEIGQRCVAEGSTVLAPVTTPHPLYFRLLKSTSKLCPPPQSSFLPSGPPFDLNFFNNPLPRSPIIIMGWLPWSSDDSNKASDGGRIAPDRTSRKRCWEGRDAFFSCLDRNDILDGIKDDKEARRKCAKEVLEFEAACSQTWVCTALVGSVYFIWRWHFYESFADNIWIRIC